MSAASAPRLPQELWEPAQVSSFLKVPIETLYAWRARSKGPRARRVGRHLRYDPDDVARWLEAQSEGRVA